MPDARSEVVIIGAGVMGCAIAFELAQQGRGVLVIDRAPASGYGSTSSSSAIVRGHYSSLQSVAMAYESLHGWLHWAEYVGDIDERGLARLEQVGTLLLKGPDRHYERVLPLYDKLLIPYEDLSAEQLRDKLPILDVRSFWPPKRPTDDAFSDDPTSLLDGAIFTSWSGYVNDPQLATHNLQKAAQRAGATFRFRADVRQIMTKRNRVCGVRLADGTRIDAPIVVNVAGPHSGVINRLAGAETDMRITTRPLRHEVHHVPAPPSFDFDHLGFHVSDPDLGIDFRPEVGNHISVGSEGPACDPKEWIDDPDRFERRVTERVWQAQVYRLARRIPSLPIPRHAKGIADLYDVTQDWIPIYDRSSIDGYYMAIGTSGNQFKNAPTVGYVMSELITGCEAGYDHDRKPLTVAARHLDLELDLGHYSRLREPQADSSLSAMG